jgi:hypothetical protein
VNCGLGILAQTLFFSEAEGRKKADCPPLSLFVLSNLTYVIYQKDRLFGKPDGPRQKSSVFSKREKLGSGSPGGKGVCVCVCACVRVCVCVSECERVCV